MRKTKLSYIARTDEHFTEKKIKLQKKSQLNSNRNTSIKETKPTFCEISQKLMLLIALLMLNSRTGRLR